MGKMKDTHQLPILIIGHRRREEIIVVLEALKGIQPQRLYLAMDGPRSDDELYLTEAARKSAQAAVEWNCELKTLFSDENLGSRDFMLKAIDWFYSEVEIGIILEDDIVISSDFIDFVNVVISSPRWINGEIGIIASICYQHIMPNGFKRKAFISRIPAIWGWATRRSIWQSFREAQEPDATLKLWFKLFRKITIWQSMLFTLCLRLVRQGKLQAWDYDFATYLLLHNKLTIYPATSLATNIGFSELATHTANKKPKGLGIKTKSFENWELSQADFKINKFYQQRQSLNTPFEIEYYSHVTKGLVALFLNTIGLRKT